MKKNKSDEIIEFLEKEELIVEYERKYEEETGKSAKVKERQKPCGPKKIEQIMMMGIKDWAEDNKEKFPDFKRNFMRNKKLVILNKANIPDNLWEQCMKDYKNYVTIPPSYDKVMNYFTNVKQRILIEKIEGFIS